MSLNPLHTFSKLPQRSIHLLAGRGVEGDAHCGTTVQHLYLQRRDRNAPNRMQVHLLQAELFDDLGETYLLGPGELGENITTRGINLLQLPRGTRLHLGATAVVELTGLRTPCKQIDTFRPGLLRAVTDKAAPPKQRGRAGVMSVVLEDGDVLPGDRLRAAMPELPYLPLCEF